MRSAWIISTGTELTLGQTVATNGAWLAARLAALGIRTQRHITVPDDEAATRAAILEAAAACDVIVVTGGLGPTDDDLTRAALAGATGAPLELHAPSLERIRAFFTARGRTMPEHNAVQALAPRHSTILPNACGTAPGILATVRGTPCYVLPGVPFEMRVMFDAEVVPRLRGATGETVVLSRRLHTFGMGESDVGEQIRDLMQRGRNPEVGTTAEFGQIGIRINATAPSLPAATTLLDETETEIRRRLGVVVFGCEDDTLARVVGELLVHAGQTLCTAESCTGGLIGTLITDVPGSSRYYAGGVIAYANDVKADLLGVDRTDLDRHGAVSEPVARALADGARRTFRTDFALSTTGIAGPDGGTAAKPVGLVYIGLASPAGTEVHEFRFGHDAPREAIRLRAARTALNLLRLKLVPPAVVHGGVVSGR